MEQNGVDYSTFHFFQYCMYIVIIADIPLVLHPLCYVLTFCTYRIINMWNSLLETVVSASTLLIFKQRLDDFQDSGYM